MGWLKQRFSKIQLSLTFRAVTLVEMVSDGNGDAHGHDYERIFTETHYFFTEWGL